MWRVPHHEPDARDVVQDAYIHACRQLAAFTEPAAFSGWLRRIVVTTALNHRRTRAQWVHLGVARAPARA